MRAGEPPASSGLLRTIRATDCCSRLLLLAPGSAAGRWPRCARGGDAWCLPELSVLSARPGSPRAEQRGCTKLLGSEGLLPAWFLFPSPPISIHLPGEVEAAADIGAGAVSYVNGCVQVQSPDPRRGASSSAKSQRAPAPSSPPPPHGRLRGAASSQPCAGDKGCCPAECWGPDPPAPDLGVLSSAPLPLGLGCWMGGQWGSPQLLWGRGSFWERRR